MRSGVDRSVRVETAELLEPWRSGSERGCAASCFLDNVDMEGVGRMMLQRDKAKEFYDNFKVNLNCS